MPTDKIESRKPPRQVFDHEHEFDDRWYPKDKNTLRRVCVCVGCCAT